MIVLALGTAGLGVFVVHAASRLLGVGHHRPWNIIGYSGLSLALASLLCSTFIFLLSLIGAANFERFMNSWVAGATMLAGALAGAGIGRWHTNIRLKRMDLDRRSLAG